MGSRGRAGQSVGTGPPDHVHDRDAADRLTVGLTDGPADPRGIPEDTEPWQPDDVLLTTVGIDIGSTTSHLMFARLRMQRLAAFSSRFVAVERTVLYRSPIALTPSRTDGSIDIDALRAFVERQYARAGLAHDDVDTGAVILTGVALASRNAAEIAAVFSRDGGKFVCATAGHRLEATLAAHGSGAVARSRREGGVMLNVDVGGTTTKLALCDQGEIVATSAIAAGSRLIAFDDRGRAVRVERAAGLFAERAGVRIGGSAPIPRHKRWRVAAAMAEAIAQAAHGRPLEPDLATAQLLEPLPEAPRPNVVTISGGVGEIASDRAGGDFGDLGVELAACLRECDLRAPLQPPDEAIRATVVGASQFSVKLSGNTIHVSDPSLLPLRNVPVVAVRLGGAASEEIAGAVAAALARSGHDGAVVVALPDLGEPRHAMLRAVADAIVRAVGERRPLVVATAGDAGLSLGRVLRDELGVESGLLVMDDLDLAELDYVDVGRLVSPAGVVPVVVKTLVLG